MMKLLAVAWREFRYTALTKAFIFAAVILPLIFYGSIPLVLAITQKRVPPLQGTVVVIDPAGDVADAARYEFAAETEEARRTRGREQLSDFTAATQDPAQAAESIKSLQNDPEAAADLAEGGALVEIELEILQSGSLDDFRTRILDGDLLAAVAIDPGILEPESTIAAEMLVPSGIKADHSRIIKRRISNAIVRARANAAGEDVESLRALLRDPAIHSSAVHASGKTTDDSDFFKEILPYAFMFLLWIAAFTGGQYLLTTTVEEKSNKLMEVLLSAISPMTLMTGKILGQGLVALVMLLMYGGLGVAALLTFASGDVAPWLIRILLVVYFVMAYFYVASLMAAVGSAVSDLHEAQTLMGPAMMVMLAPMILMIPASQDPNGVLAVVSSFIPPCTPFIMVVRLGAGEIPTWQIIATIVVGYAGVGIALWTCARIFRIGVLMQGKPPTPMQLFKWIRYS